jgi:Protein of unknown function (DUF2855)
MKDLPGSRSPILARMDTTHFVVRRDRLAEHEIVTTPRGTLAPGSAELRIDRFGFTANNVSYGLRGDSFSFWKFFPEPRPGWGRLPVWGFGTVVRSAAEAVFVGERFYGYFPMSSHLIVQPKRVDASGFFDSAPHRRDLNAVYNQYLRPSGDPHYHPDTEPQQVVVRPLFAGSFFLADFLREHAFFETDVTLVSSASSKLAYGMAFVLAADPKRKTRKLVALTSERNAPFVSRLGLYDRVITYPELATISSAARTLFIDIAGGATLRSAVHHHLGKSLRHSLLVGATHQETPGPETKLPGPEPVQFFTPTWIRRRTQQWTTAETDRRLAEAWRGFVPMLDPARGWMTITSSTGPAAVGQTYDDLVAGRAQAEHGHVLSL